jgi:hypothetical protein
MPDFVINHKDMDRLAEVFRDAPRDLRRATGMFVNNLAFGTKKQIPNTMSSLMTVRDKRFVNSRIRVEKARFSTPIDAQMSVVGSIYGPRFSGWEEQELGKKTDRHRVFTLLARLGSKQRKAKRSARMRNLSGFVKPDEFSGVSAEHRVIVMLRVLQRKNYPRPFIIHGHSKIHSGVYQFRGRGTKRKPKPIKILQSFDPRRVQPRRVPWLRQSRDKYLRSVNVTRLWENVISRAWRPRIK